MQAVLEAAWCTVVLLLHLDNQNSASCQLASCLKLPSVWQELPRSDSRTDLRSELQPFVQGLLDSELPEGGGLALTGAFQLQ